MKGFKLSISAEHILAVRLATEINSLQEDEEKYSLIIGLAFEDDCLERTIG